jgi:hypothetical protein
MHFPSIGLLLPLLIALAAAAPASPLLSNLQTGTSTLHPGCFHFQDALQSTQLYFIQFATAFSAPPQLALSNCRSTQPSTPSPSVPPTCLQASCCCRNR